MLRAHVVTNKQKEEEQVELKETLGDDIIKCVKTPEIGKCSGSSRSSNETVDSGSIDDSSLENEGVETETPVVRRSTRVRRPPVSYSP